jgi:putative tricarboxylic transport membrane protein
MVKKLGLLFYGFLVFLGVAICLASWRMGYGEAAKPGSGFLPFWCGILMTMISLWIMIQGRGKKDKVSQKETEPPQEIDPWKPLVILGAMVFYCLSFEPLGFILANFLFLVLLFRFVWQKGWGFNLATSVLINVAFYGIFQKLMEVRLPPGVLQEILFR